MAEMEANHQADDLTAERAAQFLKQHFTELLRDDGEPCVGDVALIQDLIKTARQEALREAAQVIPRNWLDPLLKGVRTSSCPEIEQLLQSIKAEIDRLAQEG